MSRLGRALVCFVVVLACLPVRAVNGQLRPVDLRCEYRRNPLGIDAPRPRLSWILESTDPGARGQMQTAYQIVVASTEDRLRANHGDLWDTGKVNADRSIQVVYDGRALASRTQVWWKVRVWDNLGRPSTWSGPAFWSMGLLKAGDWQGKWIGLDGGAGKPQDLKDAHWVWSPDTGPGSRYFRRTIDIPPDNPVTDVLLWLAGTDSTAVYVNGVKVGGGEGIKDAVSLDISSNLHSGKNVLAVSVKAAGGEPAGLVGAIQMDFARGEHAVIRTDAQWRVSSGEPASNWNKNDFDDSIWEAVKMLGGYGMAPWGDSGWAERTVLPARMVRKDFRVAEPVRRATLYISGLGLFEAYLNGTKVSQDVLVPALSEYDKRVFYLTYDVTKGLRPGDNAIGVILGNGRYFAMRHKVHVFTRTYGYPKLRLQLEIEYANGKVEHVASDESWKLTTDGPIRANNEYDGEVYDARREQEGWSRPGFNEAGWQDAQVLSGPAGTLAAQTIGPIQVTKGLKPIKITQPKPGLYIYDMGQNMVGWCRLTVSGPRGTEVSLRHAEKLRPEGTLYLDNLLSALVTDVYTLKGKGIEIYEPRFVYHGFRYVEVRGFPGKPTLASLEGREVHDAVERNADFTTSNSLLNHIFKNIVWGTEDNYRSIPTDCPQRSERQGWLGDRSSESLGEPFLFNVAAFYAKWINDIEDSQASNGSVSDVSPAYWPLYNDDVTWPASFIIIPGHLYDLYGDLRVIKEHFDGMKRWVAHMQTYLKDDLMPRDSYGDWCVPPESPELIHSSDPGRKTDGAVLGTAYFYHVLRLMERYATLLGKENDANDFNRLAARLAIAFNRKYFDKATSRYSNGSQTSSILPLAFGMVPEADQESVFTALIRKIEEQNKKHVGTGLIGGQWLMRVLSDNGRDDVAFEIASQKSYPSWGYMVGKGATTIWELWNGDTANPAMNSGNHLMLVGDLVTWLYGNLAGIRPDPAHPAFKHIILHPTPVGDLTFVRASHKSPFGKIVSEWKRDGARFTWSLTVPANTTATVFVPAKDAASVTESGKPAEQALGVKYLRAETDAAVFEVGSGNYHFVSSIVTRGAYDPRRSRGPHLGNLIK